MSDRPTPETEAATLNKWQDSCPLQVVPKSLARRLERQRDELLAACEWAVSEFGKHTRPSPLDKAIAAVKGGEG
jgi:hypothetical protein